MSYQSMADVYASPEQRARIQMCAREQAFIFVNDARDEFIKLSNDVIAGKPLAIDSLTQAVIVGPNGSSLDDDQALLAAMQQAWPAVASALYPPEPIELPDLSELPRVTPFETGDTK